MKRIRKKSKEVEAEVSTKPKKKIKRVRRRTRKPEKSEQPSKVHPIAAAVSTKSPLDELLSLSDEEVTHAENLDFLENLSMDYNPLDDGEGVDIVGMVDEAINQDTLVAPDLKIDDSSCPEAPNVFEWLMGDKFLGCEPPYLEQALVCIQLFAEYCPRCSDTEWMHIDNHEPQEGVGAIYDKVVCTHFGVCPKCGAERSELIQNGELNFYNELAMLAGQRSGKSIVTAMASTYITHRILKMQKPTDIYKVGKGQILHGTFVALTQGQAKDTLWEPYYGYLLESPWFKKYHALLRFYEKKYQQDFFKLKDTFVLYRHRGLSVYPAGPDKRVLRGRTRIFGAIDEIGWFDNNKNSDKVKINAEEVYVAMVRSLATVRSSEERLVGIGYNQAISAYMLNISSPSSVRDKICELVRQSQGSTKTLGVHAPTWKMNPNITRNTAFLVEEFRKDPITAMRDYGAEPPLSANAFINNKQWIQDIFNDKYRNIISYTSRITKVGKEQYRYAEVNKVKPSNQYSIMAIDAGYTNNSFALVVGTIGSDGVPKMDLVAEVIPLPGIPLNYTMIYEELMRPIIEARNVRIVLADRWNSLKLLHDIAIDYMDVELVTKQYSLKYPDFWNIKTTIEQTMLTIPNLEKGHDLDGVLKDTLEEYPRCFEGRPACHLALQILTVQDTGRTVTKGEGDLTDDLWRAMVLAFWGMQQDEFVDVLLTDMAPQDKPRVAALGTALLGSAGGGQLSSVGGSGGAKSTGSGGVVGLLAGRK